ncbi:MAG: ABC transporter ATP-binding protein, partial [Clostridia bacterium]|nr:ABC transporter ATP-binding protein [Clostridia bacterium]
MKKLKNIVQMSLFSIQIVFAAAPVRMLLFMVLTLVSSFIPTIKLAVYRNLFNEAQILIETPELGNVGLMMLYAAIDIGLTFMSWNVIGQIRNYIKTTVNDTYNEKVNRKIFDKLSRVKYDYFLNEETYDLMSRVQGNCRETIFTTSFYFIRVVSNFISLVSAFTYMASISPVYAIIGFLVSIPFVGITRKYNMDSYFQKRGQTPEHRKNGYLYNLLMSRNAIKEIRIDESTDYLLEQWKEQNNKLFRESHKLRRKHLYQYTYYDIFYALVRGVVIFLNVLDILKGIRLVGDLTLIINGYAVLSSATEIFGYSLSDFEVNEKLY